MSRRADAVSKHIPFRVEKRGAGQRSRPKASMTDEGHRPYVPQGLDPAARGADGGDAGAPVVPDQTIPARSKTERAPAAYIPRNGNPAPPVCPPSSPLSPVARAVGSPSVPWHVTWGTARPPPATARRFSRPGPTGAPVLLRLTCSSRLSGHSLTWRS